MRRHRSPRHLWAVLLPGVLALGGCEARLSLGGGCTFTSECNEPLVCAGGRCRAECREDRDCAGTGESCTRFGGSGAVCTPPSSTVPCRLNSDCGAGARCEGGSCRADCRADVDCAGLGSCVSGICSEPLLTPPAPGDAGVVDACTGDGRVRCPGELVCRDLSTDPENCGACGVVCPTGLCNEFFCVPANDECADAEVLDLSSGSARVARLGLEGAGDTVGTCSAGPDTFYRFHIDERRLVWAVLDLESGYQAGVGLHRTCGAAPSGCVELTAADPITRSEAMSVLDAGDYWVSVDIDNFGEDAGGRDNPWALRVYSIAVGSGAVNELILGAGTDGGAVLLPGTYSGSTLGQTSSPASCAPGPDNAYFFALNPGDLLGARSYTASTCGSGAFDSTVSLVRADGGAPLCANTDECGTHGVLHFALSRTGDSEGLYVLFVDGATATDAGSYTLTLSADP